LAHHLSEIPFSFTVHGPEEFDRAAGLSLSQKVRFAKFVACVSEYTRAQLSRWCAREDWSKLKVVRCGLDFSEFEQKESLVEERKDFVCVGRFCEQKGYFHLLKALHLLKKTGDCPVVRLLGDGPDRPAVEAEVARLGLRENVHLLGWATQSEVLALLASSRALILPSLAEGLPAVLMEAFALRTPVVATWVAGIPELVEPGVNGWLVPPGDIFRLAQSLREAKISSPEQLHEMGHRGLKKVREQHDIFEQARDLQALFLNPF
jgi:glycosyltransferase involved in cell wall biosynthesis